MYLAAAFWISAMAQATPLDDYAARPGWACSYGQERQLCLGPSEFAGLQADQVVSLCGPEGEVCSTSWKISATGADRDAAFLAFGKALQADLSRENWLDLPADGPQRWKASLRNDDTQAILELGVDGVTATVQPRPDCVIKGLIERLDPLLRAVSGVSLDSEWGAVDAMRFSGGLDDGVLARAKAQIEGAEATSDLPQRALLGSEELSCYLQVRNRRAPMEGIRAAMEEWNAWRSPDPKEVRAREKAEQLAAREARKREKLIDKGDIEDIPDEIEPEEEFPTEDDMGDPEDW